MFDQILSLIKIRQELPDAIGYALTKENHIFMLPEEISESCGEELAEVLHHLSCTYLSIDNYTNRIQKSIRVLLAGSSEFTPRVLFRRRSNRVTHEILSEENEILVHEIPPNESIYIIFYNPDTKFSIEQILVGDKMITPAMRKLAEAKRYPELIRMKFITVLMSFIVIISVIGSISMLSYTLWNRHKIDQVMKDAFSDFSICQNEIFYNSAEKEKELERRFRQLGPVGTTTLTINHVSSLDELKLKDIVILCVPLKQS
ncbi:hypothetical protein H4F46_02410 [Pectobacterium brasiliense]|uniref:hypothetical protein n=1 Tax=Pectobacterium brasiliense TaxID=180957 RepID=UPI00057F99AE|nr:hypothetical protein [Pectobacterium brasiliense]KHS75730.1 hypothetical protein RC79_03740 [Pectobacterium brasiliense]KHT20511.1 hypothetical protein RC97_00145 [Pectobacterium brasiliense]MBN3113752.1 hypothetical protein [Pectobacterium brasiliense]